MLISAILWDIELHHETCASILWASDKYFMTEQKEARVEGKIPNCELPKEGKGKNGRGEDTDPPKLSCAGLVKENK